MNRCFCSYFEKLCKIDQKKKTPVQSSFNKVDSFKLRTLFRMDFDTGTIV